MVKLRIKAIEVMGGRCYRQGSGDKIVALNVYPSPEALATEFRMTGRQQSNREVTMHEREKQGLDCFHLVEGETQIPKKRVRLGKANAMKHGIWANRFLSNEEREVFNDVVQRFRNDFVFNRSSDFMQVELVALYTVKLMRADAEGDMDATERIDRMLRCHLKDLKSTKITREKKEESKKREMTPAEWATSFIEKMKKQQEAEKEAENKLAEKEKRENS